DLRVRLPGGRAWAVDVKDRASPALLGMDAVPLPAMPAHDAAFLVVPRYRFRDRPDYRTVFSRYCPPEAARAVTLLTDQERGRRHRARECRHGLDRCRRRADADRGYDVADLSRPAVRRTVTRGASRWDVYATALDQPPAFERRPLPLATQGGHWFLSRQRHRL